VAQREGVLCANISGGNGTMTTASEATYLGAFGYNDSPAALGRPGGFWQFENYGALVEAYIRSADLDSLFERMGAPTYSLIIQGVDEAGYVILHLLVIATQPVYARQNELLEMATMWLNSQGRSIEKNALTVGGIPRPLI
jgi:hypothetical protein